MKHQRGKRKGYLGKYEDPIAPEAHLNVDVMGPILEKSKQKYIIIGVSRLLKYLWTKRFPRCPTTENATKFMEGICAEYEEWPIKKITTDQGTIFQSRKWREKLEENDIKWQRTSVYHPESDGLAERYVQTISKKLRCSGVTVRNNWIEKLKDITEVFNRTPLGIHGYTPEEIITNKCDIEEIKLKMIREQQRRDEKINTKRIAHTLRQGQQVL
jgi:hypothetical protein